MFSHARMHALHRGVRVRFVAQRVSMDHKLSGGRRKRKYVCRLFYVRECVCILKMTMAHC